MNKEGKILPSQGTLLVRTLAGAYLVYLSYSLFKERADSGMSPVAMWSFIIIFTLIGLFLCGMSLFSLVKGTYKGGSADVGEKNDVVDGEATEKEEELIEDTSDDKSDDKEISAIVSEEEKPQE